MSTLLIISEVYVFIELKEATNRNLDVGVSLISRLFTP